MKTKKLGINLVIQLIIKFIAVLLAVFTTRWLISNVSSSELAEYNVGLAFVSVVVSIIHGGIPNVIQKYYTNNHNIDEIGHFWSTFALIRFISYFAGIILIFLGYKVSGVTNIGLLLSIYTIMWLLIADLSYRSICDALAKTWQFNLTDVLARLLILLALIGYGYSGLTLYSPLSYFIFVSGIAYLCGLVADAIWQRKNAIWRVPQMGILKIHLRSMTYLWISAVTVALFLTTDKLFLRYFNYSDEVINGYSNAYKVFETAGIIPGIIMPTIASMVKKRLDVGMQTKVSRYFQTKWNITQSTSIVYEWLLYTSVLGILTFLVMLVISPIFINIIDPTLKYPLAMNVLPFLTVPILLLFFIHFFLLLTIFMDGEKYELIGTSIILCVTVLLYFVLIPPFGIYGAGIATLGGYICDVSVKTYFFSRSFREYMKLTKSKVA
jgi:O-antigen/teichoic acid export membrane protein